MLISIQTSLISILVVAICVITAYAIGYFKGRKLQLTIQKASLKLQRSVVGGLLSEQVAPFLPDFPKELKASEARFIGKPIDFIFFKGMDEKNIEEVVFVEVKSGKSHLTSHEQKLRDVIQEKKVRWYEYRVDEQITALSPKDQAS